MTPETAQEIAQEPADRFSLRPFLVLGYATLILTALGIGAWGAMARISGAVIAPGAVEVEGNRQIVQHLEGGVIAAIHVRDGDVVEAGDILVELEGDALRSELEIVEGQWYELLARRGRLSAERDLAPAIDHHPDLVVRAQIDPEVAELIKAQQVQFDARRKVKAEEAAQLTEREIQIENQNEGLQSVLAATKAQIGFVKREVASQEELLAQGLTQLTRLLTPQREFARLEGSAGQVEAAIAENRGKIAETGIERVRLVSETQEQAISELRDIEYREIELRERRLALIDQIGKLDLRAPVAGVVYGNTADTLRGVIRPAEPVLYIVPNDANLIVRVQIETMHIDKVHVGQPATLRFSAFDTRTTPEVEGAVSKVSADALEDEATRTKYYSAEILISEEARAELAGLVILPGMPVEAFVLTDERSPVAYLVKPLSDYFLKAFRES
ncbi:MAG: HlyD family type I secretion periplasmic adaptor subunit [Rhodobacteraceae bacterium]|nr:HlyD family type I secretion periplasmic adaptor subunit [Paracoccaceae bacterium]